MLFRWKGAKHEPSSLLRSTRGLLRADRATARLPASINGPNYFPFDDNVHNAAKAGIAALIQPGGSIRDEDVVKAADQHNMTMVFTGVRHFRH